VSSTGSNDLEGRTWRRAGERQIATAALATALAGCSTTPVGSPTPAAASPLDGRPDRRAQDRSMFGRPVAGTVERSGALERDLASFFAEHYDRLVRLAALVCHSPGATEDAVQAAMEQAWRRRSTLRDPERIRPWLDRIVVRESIRANRRPWWARFAPGEADTNPAPSTARRLDDATILAAATDEHERTADDRRPTRRAHCRGPASRRG
jgi:DNA-directed RNA polymerase specialized sigma24 family protein